MLKPLCLGTRKSAILTLCLGLILIDACFEPGGGGTTHVPPKVIVKGSPTPLTLEVTAVNVHGLMSKRITRITCHYRQKGASSFTALPMAVTDVDERTLIARVSLPPFSNVEGDSVEYYFDFYSEGKYDQRGSPSQPEAIVPIQ